MLSKDYLTPCNNICRQFKAQVSSTWMSASSRRFSLSWLRPDTLSHFVVRSISCDWRWAVSSSERSSMSEAALWTILKVEFLLWRSCWKTCNMTKRQAQSDIRNNWTKQQKGEWMNSDRNDLNRWMNEWTNAWMDKLFKEWMNEWIRWVWSDV